ncbi:YbaK/EbsC family protein [Streptomyces millisiae]|uniref:YbaK/EbsC family protein n=1 Tax=Streptomyces millisiae TaxID=3075542 RepID=A0ABU2LNP7_9ACTN|nr:YbaK/EbsC family protein [Streptomyces sp. DSM 44918]MDT0319193.1 YbaK/EbsC family protein [Streptomyces sp. DSM 44918]
MTSTGATSALERVRAGLVGAGHADEIVELATEVPTAAAAAERLGCPVGAIANSLVFEADGAPLLVVASGGHRVDVRKAARHLGVRKVRRATPEFVFQATGQLVGGVAPVGHPAPLRTLVDTALADHPEVWAGAGVSHAMFRTTFAQLVTLTGGDPVDVGQ